MKGGGNAGEAQTLQPCLILSSMSDSDVLPACLNSTELRNRMQETSSLVPNPNQSRVQSL